MFKIKNCRSKLKKTLNHQMITVLGSLGVICSIFSGFSYAVAQEINDQQIMQYAKAVLLIESNRQQAYKEIQQIIGQEPPEIVCNQPKTYKNLPPNAQEIAKNFCTTSEDIVQNSGLSVSQFNEITTAAQSDNSLERRIQNALLEIQQ